MVVVHDTTISSCFHVRIETLALLQRGPKKNAENSRVLANNCALMISASIGNDMFSDMSSARKHL